MKVLFQGIWNLFNAGGDFKTNLSARLYLKLAPENATYPYAVYDMVTNVHDWMFTDDPETEEYLIQFDIVSDTSSSTEALNLFENLKTMFDWCSLTITGYTFLYMRRESSHLLQVDEKWQHSTTYRVLVHK